MYIDRKLFMPMWAEPPKACSSAVRCVCICVQYRSRFSALRCNSNTGAVSFLCVRFTSSRERVSTGARRVSCARLARVGDVTFERYCMCHSVFNGMTLLTQLAADQNAQKKFNVNRRPKLDQHEKHHSRYAHDCSRDTITSITVVETLLPAILYWRHYYQLHCSRDTITSFTVLETLLPASL